MTSWTPLCFLLWHAEPVEGGRGRLPQLSGPHLLRYAARLGGHLQGAPGGHRAAVRQSGA
eukprot:3989116-Alexandrium_andersonii.AAC.1